jgi:vacuolar-type H+-ATPase subunit E/Vma4
MIALSEMQLRVLSELEEAGQENLPTIANTIDYSTVDSDLRSLLDAALVALVRADLVRIAIVSDSLESLDTRSADESIKHLAHLESHLIFSEDLGRWTGGSRPWPEVVATASGREKASEILSDRGYRWWRKS